MQIKQFFIYLFLGGGFLAPYYSWAQSTSHSPFERKYAQRETYRYKLTTRECDNGQWARTSEAICAIKVVLDSSGIPYD